MPNLTSNASTFRRGGYTYNGYISTIPQTVVLAGTVSAVPTYPALAVAYTLTSGSAGAAVGDMTVNFYGAAGGRKSTLRVATGATTTSTSLKVNEFSEGVYAPVIGDTFQVVKEWRIWDRLVSATAALDKDSRIAYSDQNANPYPVANSGGATAGFTLTRSFTGSDSFVIDPDSSTVTHAWDFVDGTPSSSTSANPSNIAFPVGFRWVKHTVTDSGNSKATVQYVPVWIHGDGYTPLDVQVDSLNGNTQSGWRCTFKLPHGSDGDISTLPDGALIAYWEQERYNNTEAYYGNQIGNRANMKFVGYLVRDSIRIDSESSEVTFEAVSPLAILEQTPALPQLMVSANTPAKWSELKGLSTKKMFAYLSSWHTSLQDAFDFVWNDGVDVSYDRIAVEGQTIAEQLRDIANSLNLEVTCDRLGRILFTRDPDFLTSGERSSRTKAYDFTSADIMELDVTREHRWQAKFVRGEGITSGNAPVFSNSPGNAPASLGIGSETLAKQIVTSQADLNTRTGHQFAKVNSLYYGQIVPNGVRVKLPDGYDVFDPAYREFVTLALASSFNSRGVFWTDATRWTIESVDITYAAELDTKDITLTIDHETIGLAGVTYVPPQDSENGLEEFPPLDLDFPELGFDPDTGFGVDPGAPVPTPLSPTTNTFAAFCTDDKVYFTGDFETPEGSGGPEYTNTDLSGLANWGGGELIGFSADAYSPAYLGTGDEVNGWILTTEAVQKVTDIFGTIALETPHVFADPSATRTIKFERGVQNFGIVASWYAEDGIMVAVTTDGDTWDEDLLTADYNTTVGGISPGVYISPFTDGKAYVSVWTQTDDAGVPQDAVAEVYRTLNYGTSWSLLASPAVDSGFDISSFLTVPDSSSAGTTVYHRKRDGDGTYLIRRVSGTETDITPVSDVGYVPIGRRLNEAAIPTSNRNKLMWIGVSGAAGGGSFFVDVPATAGSGIDSGVAVTTGEEVTITAPDTWRYNATDYCGANGVPGYIPGSDPNNGFLIVPSIAPGALLYKVGGAGAWALAGDEITFTSPASDNIYFIMNEYIGVGLSFSDNLGSLNVTIETEASGALIYAVFITPNAAASAPTWTVVDEGDADAVPYRQVFALSASSFLLIGEAGSIGISDGTSIDSRKGNISTIGEIIGTAAV